MKISECKNAPEWLIKANTEDADVEVLAHGWVIWHSGNFLGGNFRGGDFLGGNFRGGNFLGGDFLGGNFLGDDFLGGNFLGGNFRGGDFLGGDFLGGNFRGGNFRGGNFLGGNFLGGNFLGGDFLGGNFLDGNFLGGDFRGGNFLGGDFLGVSSNFAMSIGHAEGYTKVLVGSIAGVAYIYAGCRWFTLAEAKKHWNGKKDRRPLTCALLLSATEIARIKGLKEE